MRQRPLGRSGLTVSEIGFGCGNVGGLLIRGERSEQLRAVDRAIELGITYFDTAAQYGDGVSEQNLGAALRELRPDVLVGTKLGLTPADLGNRKWVFDHDFFILLNLAVGGQWPGYPDDTTTFPQTMLVDYVRVYQLAGGGD